MMKLSLDELAKSLDLPPNTLERWIRQGRIPVQRKSGDCLFQRETLREWAKRHDLDFCFSGNYETAAEGPVDEPVMESLTDTMRRGGVQYGLTGTDVPSVLSSAVKRLTGLSDDVKEEMLGHLLAREEMTSTGIGKGVAIPHPRSPIAGLSGPPFITTFFMEEPVDYRALDDKPVFVLFLLFSRSVKSHLHLLSRLAFCLRDDSFFTFLTRKPEPESLFERIGGFETKLDKARP